MKRIKTQLAILMLGLSAFLLSCSDFLDQENPSVVSVDTYWNNKEEAEAMLAGCYNVLQQQGLYYNYYNSCDPRALDGFGTTDGNSGWWFWSPAEMALSWGNQSPSHELVDVVWKACYKGIARCNEVIYYVPQMGEEKITQADADRILGEAKFLRAFYYNYLTSLFRDVPLSKEPTLTGYIPISSKADIVDFITQELKGVAESDVLPVTVAAEERGRATKGAAWALLCRIYLYNEKWIEAAEAAKEVMTLGYELENDYLTLFSEAGNTSKEVIFSVRFSATADGTDNEMRGVLSTRNNEDFLTPIVVNQNLMDEYYDINGNSIAESSYSTDELKEAENRDPRWRYNFVFKKADDGGITGYINKYQDYTVTEKNADNQDYYVIRYADVLLMRAEALAMVNSSGNKTEIEGLINQIRDRVSVGMPHVTDAEITNAGGLLNVIKHERRVELAFEGHRYFDLRRWGEYNKLTEYNYIGETKSHVWPIPQGELDNNKSLVQAAEWGGK